MPFVGRAGFGFFHPVRPPRRLRRGGFQPANILLQLFVAAAFKLVLPRPVFRPGTEIPLLDFDPGTVDRQDMIHTAVQKRPVM